MNKEQFSNELCKLIKLYDAISYCKPDSNELLEAIEKYDRHHDKIVSMFVQTSTKLVVCEKCGLAFDKIELCPDCDLCLECCICGAK